MRPTVYVTADTTGNIPISLASTSLAIGFTVTNTDTCCGNVDCKDCPFTMDIDCAEAIREEARKHFQKDYPEFFI